MSYKFYFNESIQQVELSINNRLIRKFNYLNTIESK